MVYRTLKVEKSGVLAYVRLTRGDAGNPVDGPFLQELDDACASINDDPEARVVLLTAEGDVFSKGWKEAATPLSREHAGAFACLEAVGQPVICVLHGDATSAGLELALACDVRVAAKEASFALPETGQGMIPMAGGTQRLARLVGRGEALLLVLLGEEIGAAEAFRIGLVSAIWPRAELAGQALTLAQRMAARGPLALRYAKEAVRRGLEQPLDQALRYETDLTVILQTTDDRAEGVQAFLEKREPKFKGT